MLHLFFTNLYLKANTYLLFNNFNLLTLYLFYTNLSLLVKATLFFTDFNFPTLYALYIFLLIITIVIYYLYLF